MLTNDLIVRAVRDPAFLARFWRRVMKTRGCWLWHGATAKGYGQLSAGERHQLVTAHRVAWTAAHGRIPDGLCVLHRCDVRSCANPDHLFLGTVTDNRDDAVAKGRQAKGERNGRAKLTAESVRAIRTAVEHNTLVSVAERFGVSVRAVRFIMLRETWAHIV